MSTIVTTLSPTVINTGQDERVTIITTLNHPTSVVLAVAQGPAGPASSASLLVSSDNNNHLTLGLDQKLYVTPQLASSRW